jgi:succinate dehydrogenase hydrophobic anchor subunit
MENILLTLALISLFVCLVSGVASIWNENYKIENPLEKILLTSFLMFFCFLFFYYLIIK